MPKRDNTVPGPSDVPPTVNPLVKPKSISHLKVPQTKNCLVSLLRQPLPKSSQSPESSPANCKLLQPPTPQSASGQGLYGLELPLLRSITASVPYTTVEIRKYAIRVIKQGEVSFTKEKDGSLSATLSDLVLKRCKDQSSSQSDRKKLNKPETRQTGL